MRAALQRRLQRALQRAWLVRGPLACLLWPLSKIYGALVALRQWRYAVGYLPSQKFEVPVVVVGNVVAGGTGKTPVLMALARHLSATGWRIGMVSRGYGRGVGDCREVLPTSLACEVGDEPLLASQTFARSGLQIPVFVAAQRSQAASALLASYPQTQLILSDDGLQHYALQRDLEICVFDDRGVGNGWLLPAGLLREPWPRRYFSSSVYRTSSLVLHTGSSPVFAGYQARRQLADYAVDRAGRRWPLRDLRAAGQPILALAGIAQPEAFFAMLRAQGVPLAHTLALPDHYDFSSFTRTLNLGYRLICTEKDAVKLWAICPDALAAVLLLEADPAFLAAVDSALAQLSSADQSPA